MGKKKTPAAGPKPAGKAKRPAAGKKPAGKKPAAGRKPAPKPAAAAPAVTAAGDRVVTIAEALRVYEKYRNMLLGLPGVVNVTCGVKRENGSYLFGKAGERPVLAVTVHVREKMADPGRGHLPADLEGVPTDVVVAPAERKPIRLRGAAAGGDGVELLHAGDVSGGTGTLGVIARDAAVPNSKVLFALTCAHVAYGQGYVGAAGDRIVLAAGGQPPPAGPRPTFGLPDRHGFDPAFIPTGVGPQDAAGVRLAAGLAPPVGVVRPHGKVAAAPLPLLNPQLRVGIHGAKTTAGVTGRIPTLAGVHRRVATQNGVQDLFNLVRIEPTSGTTFGVAGDSGSVVVGEDENGFPVAVALYMGTDEEHEQDDQPGLTYGLAVRLTTVLAGLKLKLV